MSQGSAFSAVEIRVRFLKLVDRSVRKLIEPMQALEGAPAFEPVPLLEVEGRGFASWQEAIECEVTVPACNLDALCCDAT